MFKTTLRRGQARGASWPVLLSHGLRSPGGGVPRAGMVNLTREQGVYVYSQPGLCFVCVSQATLPWEKCVDS